MKTIWTVLLIALAGRLAAQDSGPVMYAHFINVDQGAATLLEFPCGLVLIDAGGQNANDVDRLVSYINGVCKRRGDETKTLKSVIVTHAHADHTRGLRKVAESFRIEHYVDNGVEEGRGPKWIQANATTGDRHIDLRRVRETELASQPHRVGVTDDAIDPVKCGDCDPRILVLSGGFDDRPGWGDEDVENPNNESLVIRIDYGRASFLFPGDLETAGIRELVRAYADSKLLDVDVYAVSHHGSANATTPELLTAVTPRIAVISVGPREAVENPDPASATHYGVPNRNVVTLLSSVVKERRSQPLLTYAASGSGRFGLITVKKKVYATGWDGTIKVRATLDGEYAVTTER